MFSAAWIIWMCVYILGEKSHLNKMYVKMLIKMVFIRAWCAASPHVVPAYIRDRISTSLKINSATKKCIYGMVVKWQWLPASSSFFLNTRVDLCSVPSVCLYICIIYGSLSDVKYYMNVRRGRIYIYHTIYYIYLLNIFRMLCRNNHTLWWKTIKT